LAVAVDFDMATLNPEYDLQQSGESVQSFQTNATREKAIANCLRNKARQLL
jgi:hypothetical protein